MVNWFTCLVRCLPVASLCLFVALHGYENDESYIYSRRILFGLVFACIGDAWLTNFKEFMIQGTICFAIAHLSYISAFGFQPLKPVLGALCLGLSSFFYYMFCSALNGVLPYATFIYMLILTTTVWRSIARLELLEGRWTCSKLCASIGAIMLFISDCALSAYMFIGPFRGGQMLFMSTYYGGQLGIALSVVNTNVVRNSSDNRSEKARFVGGSRGVPTTKMMRKKARM